MRSVSDLPKMPRHKTVAALNGLRLAMARRMTFDREWYLEGVRHGPGVYVLMRVGPVPEGYEPTF